MSFWEKLSPTEAWDVLRNAPKIAGPWQLHTTENQRVEEMYVRKTLQPWQVWDPHPMPEYSTAMVYGPMGADKRWNYKVSGECRSLPTKEEALARADELLQKQNWLLATD